MLSKEKRCRTAVTWITTLVSSGFYGGVEMKFEKGMIVNLRLTPSVRIEDLAIDLGVVPPPDPKMMPVVDMSAV